MLLDHWCMMLFHRSNTFKLAKSTFMVNTISVKLLWKCDISFSRNTESFSPSSLVRYIVVFLCNCFCCLVCSKNCFAVTA